MVARAFTKGQAARLAGATERQVSYWANTGVLEPSILHDRSGRPHVYLYSFEDVVGLRTLSILRNKHRFSLQGLRKAGALLEGCSGRPWSELRFWVRGRDLFNTDPNSGVVISSDSRKQSTVKIELEQVASQVREDASRIIKRDPKDAGRVERRRTVQRNQPVFRGTRVPVVSITNLIDSGYSTQAILDEFPSLFEADVRAARLHPDQSPAA